MDRGRSRERVTGIQRSRLLAAAVEEFDERGYAATTVAHITGRARVSRRTFYELFAGREACLAAVLADARELIEQELAAAGLADRPWCERVRGGLELILGFFDREPALARVCVVHALQAGGAVREYRERSLECLIDAVDAGRADDEDRRGADLDAGRAGSRGAQPDRRGTQAGVAGVSCLTAEGVVGAALTIVHSRLARGERGALTGLVSELTGMIVLPYRGVAAARREQQRPAPSPVARGGVNPPAVDPLNGVAMRLTYRTVRILECAQEHPGASNRELADLAGIHDQGQASKLLARLLRLGLLVNSGVGQSKGEPNVWSLTLKGQRLVGSLGAHTALSNGGLPGGRLPASGERRSTTHAAAVGRGQVNGRKVAAVSTGRRTLDRHPSGGR